MATTVARLQAVLSADTRDFDRTMDRSETKMGKVGKAAGIAGLAIAGGLAVGAKAAVGAASDLNEQINKTSVVFGKNGKEVQDWSKGLSRNFGMSQRAALEAAGTYGNMLKPMGIIPSKVKTMSMRMVELAGDMASFNNASPEETLDALRAGLAGETEPLRRFGVFLNEAAIQAQAVSGGIVKMEKDTSKIKLAQIQAEEAQKKYTQAVKEHGIQSDEAQKASAQLEYVEDKLTKALAGKVPKLTAAQKALATYEIITKSTKDAQGDFANTSDSVANQQRILKAEVEDLQASMGQLLLPVVKVLAGWMSRLTGFFAENHGAAKALFIGLGALAAVLVTASVGAKVVTSATQLYTAAQWLLNAALTANPIGLVVVALGVLAAALVVAYKRSETFREIVTGAFNAARDGFEWIRDKAGPAIATMWKIAKVPLEAFKLEWDAIATLLDKIKDAIGWVADHIPKLPKLPDLNPFGDPADPNMTAPPATGGALGKLTGNSTINPALWDELGLAKQMGLVLTSGYRPGAITKHGTRSDHSIFPSKAIDVAGSPSQMAGFFMALLGRPGIKQAFYDPLGSIFNGVRSTYREGGHSDHVHVATYDQGGYLKPGWNLAYNGLGRPEAVGGGSAVFNVQVGGEHLVQIVWDGIRRKAQVFERQNGRPAFGGGA